MSTPDNNELFFETYTLPSIEETEEILSQMPGYSSIKEVFHNLDFLLQEENRHLIPYFHMCFSGGPDSGMKMKANLIASLLHYHGEIQNNQLLSVSAMDMLGSTREETRTLTQKYCHVADNSLLFIEDIFLLIDNPSEDTNHALRRECIRTLIHEMQSSENHFIVIFAGFPDDIHYFAEKNHPELLPFIYQIVEIPDLSPQECLQVFTEYCEQDELVLSQEASDLLSIKFASQAGTSPFGNHRMVHDVYLKVKQDFYEARTDNQNVIEQELIHVDELDKLYQEDLQGLVVRKDVEAQLQEMIDEYRFSHDHNLNAPLANHLLFLGNPGTGKTSMLKYYVALLLQNGVLKTMNQLVTLFAFDVLAQSNITEYLMKRILEAENGILIIEDADHLFCDHYSGQTVLSLIMKFMDEGRYEISFIFTGRSKKLEHLLYSTPEFSSLLTHVIKFNDYTLEELQVILDSLCSNAGLTLTDAGKERFTELISELKKTDFFENARTVRMLFEQAYRNHVKDCQNDPEKDSLTFLDAEDFTLPEFFESHARHVALGFSSTR